MQIVIDNGSHSLDNLGDLAMLKLAAEQLRDLYPNATLQVVTNEPAELQRQLPFTRPLLTPLAAWPGWLRRLGHSFSSRFMPIIRPLLAGSSRLKSSNPVYPSRMKLEPIDLMVLSGCGVLADPFHGPAILRLNRLRQAQLQGVPSALMSQGIGPLENSDLRQLAAKVFAEADLIALRERIHGPKLLAALGVPPAKSTISGDDSLALAYKFSANDLHRSALGLNLRLAGYSRLAVDGVPAELSPRLAQFCAQESTQLVPIAIHRADHQQLRAALPGLHHLFSRVEHDHSLSSLLASLARCRLVVTGSYHAAVLALGMGTPALCLAASRYYRWKFEGLADLFPEGCLVYDLQNERNFNEFESQLNNLWSASVSLRPTLLARAAEQVDRSRAAYQRLADLL